MGSNLGDSNVIPSIPGDSCHCLNSGWNLRIHLNLGDTLFTVVKWLSLKIKLQLYSPLRFEWRTQYWGKQNMCGSSNIFQHGKPWFLKMSCIMYMSYYRFLITFRLSPSFRRLSGIEFIISTLCCTLPFTRSCLFIHGEQAKVIKLCVLRFQEFSGITVWSYL